MKMVVVGEEAFEKIFDETLKKLELEKLREKEFDGYAEQKYRYDELYRKFRYEVCRLKNRLDKE